MTNRDLVFLLIMLFWLFAIVGLFVFKHIIGLQDSYGLNIGGCVYLFLFVVFEKFSPGFRDWLNTKL